MRQTLNLHLPGDIDNLLRGLAMSTSGMPPGEYRRGYAAALAAVGVALGMAPERTQEPEPQTATRLFEGIEDIPFAISAFAHLGQ